MIHLPENENIPQQLFIYSIRQQTLIFSPLSFMWLMGREVTGKKKRDKHPLSAGAAPVGPQTFQGQMG